VHGLEDARLVGVVGSDVRARRHPHPTLDRGSEVGEDVGEEVRGDNDVETPRISHHPRRQRIDEDAFDADLGKVSRDLIHELVPEHVPVAGSVGLRRAGQKLASGPRRLERVPNDALHAGTGEDARLEGDLSGEPLMRSAAHSCVLAFGVLAYEEHVHVVRASPRQGGGDSGQEPARAQVGPQVETLPDLEDHAPERDVIGDGRVADRPEQHGVVGADDVERVCRHHPAVLVVVGRAPR